MMEEFVEAEALGWGEYLARRLHYPPRLSAHFEPMTFVSFHVPKGKNTWV